MSARGLRKCFRCGRKMPVKKVDFALVWVKADHETGTAVADRRWICRATKECAP